MERTKKAKTLQNMECIVKHCAASNFRPLSLNQPHSHTTTPLVHWHNRKSHTRAHLQCLPFSYLESCFSRLSITLIAALLCVQFVCFAHTFEESLGVLIKEGIHFGNFIILYFTQPAAITVCVCVWYRRANRYGFLFLPHLGYHTIALSLSRLCHLLYCQLPFQRLSIQQA